jgi:glycosyltransferase involved in cell wall biosynthesis
MKIVIATGIYPPDIGGPAQYAREMERAWTRAGHAVQVLVFRTERRLPTGIRHLYYFFRVLWALRGVDFVFSPDTFSAALPAVCAAKLLSKQIIIRTGGDFLWEEYVERTGDLVLLRNFYATRMASLNLKERLVFRLMRFVFRRADVVVFSTAWQRDIFAEPYHLNSKKCFVVENCYVPSVTNKPRSFLNGKKVFVAGVRERKWKNMPRLQRAFAVAERRDPSLLLQWETGSRGKFLQDIKDSYAVIIASLGDVSPNTILEAISFGIPFILTRETGLYERLKDVAVWVNPEDEADIAEKILWLADERNYTIQTATVRSFSFSHSWDDIADELFSLAHRI